MPAENAEAVRIAPGRNECRMKGQSYQLLNRALHQAADDLKTRVDLLPLPERPLPTLCGGSRGARVVPPK